MFKIILYSLTFLFPQFLWACPVCSSLIGETVRLGIFNSDFFIIFAKIILPFIGFIVLVLLI